MLIALAAWQPSKRLDVRRLRGAGMLALPAGFPLTSLGLLLVYHYARVNDLAVWLASASVGTVVVRFTLTFRQNLRMLRSSETEATTDALTGLGNRRALLHDLQAAGDDAGPEEVTLLALLDLDGFKSYNDAFGHPAGDALLERLGGRMADAVRNTGRAYRMGGDEFCLLARAERDGVDRVAMTAAAALSEHGERFAVSCSYGVVVIGEDTDHPDERAAARRPADVRAQARRAPTPVGSIHNVLMSVVGEQDRALRDHVGDVADLAERVARQLRLSDDHIAHVRRAAELHDVGKVAIPDGIVHAPRALEPQEWEYMRQHSIIGARIIATAPELRPIAEIVRSSHERWDGGGYPEGLAGDDIPLGARIVAVCAAYDAMTTTRPYRAAISAAHALAELRHCSGSQFDVRVADAFAVVVGGDARPADDLAAARAR